MFNVTCLLVIVYSAKVRRLPEPVRKVCRFLHVKYVKSAQGDSPRVQSFAGGASLEVHP